MGWPLRKLRCQMCDEHHRQILRARDVKGSPLLCPWCFVMTPPSKPPKMPPEGGPPRCDFTRPKD